MIRRERTGRFKMDMKGVTYGSGQFIHTQAGDDGPAKKRAPAARPLIGNKARNKESGEIHLERAAKHEERARMSERAMQQTKGTASLSWWAQAKESREQAAWHKGKAAEFAAAAGDEWDESKHPRDENGKFA